MGILIFVILNLINVILQTLKSILTVKSTPKVASIINAITFGFYVVVIKQLSDFNLIITVIVTVIANLIGVQIGTTIIKRFTKDQLWKITVIPSTVFDSNYIMNKLDDGQIAYTIIPTSNDKEVIDIFSRTQNETIAIQKIIDKTNSYRYYVPVNNI